MEETEWMTPQTRPCLVNGLTVGKAASGQMTSRRPVRTQGHSDAGTIMRTPVDGTENF